MATPSTSHLRRWLADASGKESSQPHASPWWQTLFGQALTTGGGVQCWGYNYAGNLGNGISANMTVPVGVVGFTGNGPAVGPALGPPAPGPMGAVVGGAGAARRRRS